MFLLSLADLDHSSSDEANKFLSVSQQNFTTLLGCARYEKIFSA